MDENTIYSSERQALMTRLLDSVKQCQVRFGGKTELATEYDSCVSCLCAAWESALQHGMKHSNKALATLKQMTEMTGLNKMTKGIGILDDLQKIETEPDIWHYVRDYLNKHELQRFHLLKNITTDAGRGRAWLRSTLNEHSLEKYLHMMLDENSMANYFEEWSFMRDAEKSSMMPMMAAGLGSILFAISIDNKELNTIKPATGIDSILSSPTPPQTFAPRVDMEPQPVIAGSVETKEVVVERKRSKKKKRKPVHLVSFDEGELSSSPSSSLTSPRSVSSEMTLDNLPVIVAASGQNSQHTEEVATVPPRTEDPPAAKTETEAVVEPELTGTTEEAPNLDTLSNHSGSSAGISWDDKESDKIVVDKKIKSEDLISVGSDDCILQGFAEDIEVQLPVEAETEDASRIAGPAITQVDSTCDTAIKTQSVTEVTSESRQLPHNTPISNRPGSLAVDNANVSRSTIRPLLSPCDEEDMGGAVPKYSETSTSGTSSVTTNDKCDHKDTGNKSDCPSDGNHSDSGSVPKSKPKSGKLGASLFNVFTKKSKASPLPFDDKTVNESNTMKVPKDSKSDLNGLKNDSVSEGFAALLSSYSKHEKEMLSAVSKKDTPSGHRRAASSGYQAINTSVMNVEKGHRRTASYGRTSSFDTPEPTTNGGGDTSTVSVHNKHNNLERTDSRRSLPHETTHVPTETRRSLPHESLHRTDSGHSVGQLSLTRTDSNRSWGHARASSIDSKSSILGTSVSSADSSLYSPTEWRTSNPFASAGCNEVLTPLDIDGKPVDNTSGQEDTESYDSSSLGMPSTVDTEQAAFALLLAQKGIECSSTFRTDGDGQHSPVPSFESPQSLSPSEMKQALVAMMIRKDEVENNNRRLANDLSEERETLATLKEQLESLLTSSKLQQERDQESIRALNKESTLLKHQLKKYVSAVQMLRAQGSSANIDVGVALENLPPPIPSPKSSILVDYSHEASEYEKKLIQVAEMHGELMEFNEVLHRQCNQKDALIQAMKVELEELRGPLPETFEEVAQAATESADGGIRVASQPLVHIWIPSAFLRGSTDSHHVYQVFIRILDEEWNVFRRYTDFHNLHSELKKANPLVNTFQFPPKKAIGNKDSRFVENRRRKLQSYLRLVVNMLTQSEGELSRRVTKQTLLAAMPFLSDESKGDKSSKKKVSKRNSGGGRGSVTAPSCVSAQVYMGL